MSDLEQDRLKVAYASIIESIMGSKIFGIPVTEDNIMAIVVSAFYCGYNEKQIEKENTE